MTHSAPRRASPRGVFAPLHRPAMPAEDFRSGTFAGLHDGMTNRRRALFVLPWRILRWSSLLDRAPGGHVASQSERNPSRSANRGDFHHPAFLRYPHGFTPPHWNQFRGPNGQGYLEGGLAENNIAWEYPRFVPEAPSILYCDGRIYRVRGGGLFVSPDAETGDLIYRERVGADGQYMSSPAAAEGRMQIASVPDAVPVLKAGGGFEETMHAIPDLCGNAIYAGTERRLYAFSRQAMARGRRIRKTRNA